MDTILISGFVFLALLLCGILLMLKEEFVVWLRNRRCTSRSQVLKVGAGGAVLGTIGIPENERLRADGLSIYEVVFADETDFEGDVAENVVSEAIVGGFR